MYDDYKFVTRKDLENLGETFLPRFLLTNLTALGGKKKLYKQFSSINFPLFKSSVFRLLFNAHTAKEITVQRGNLIPALQVKPKTINQSDLLAAMRVSTGG